MSLLVSYYPYGKILRHYQEDLEKYQTTQHERDQERLRPREFPLKTNLNEQTGLDYRGARFYDSDVGRFLSLDPAAAEYPTLSDYCYVAGKPIMFIDPDGRKIVVPNKSDQGTVLSHINSLSRYVFDFNDAGELVQLASPNADGGSAYYGDRIAEAIMSDESITIYISENVDAVDEKGDTKVVNVDDKWGGGVTNSDGEGGQIVVISGNENEDLKDVNGNKLEDTPEYILMHELVGHAIPRIVGGGSDNSVEEENKVRDELDQPLRQGELNHTVWPNE